MSDQRQARDEAMERVETGSAWWKPYALKAVYEAACLRREITSDDVWRVLHLRGIRSPKEPRAMGPIMVSAQRVGWIEQTDRTKISDDPSTANHSRPQRVYVSRVVDSVLPSWEKQTYHAVHVNPVTLQVTDPIDDGRIGGGRIIRDEIYDQWDREDHDESERRSIGREFPLRRNDDGMIEIEWITCPECGEQYAVRADHLRTREHRTAIAKASTLEGVLPIPDQPQPAVFDVEPAKLEFGSTVLCPRCKGLRRKHKGKLSGMSMDPHDTKKVCPRCGGFGIVPNQSPIP